MSTLRVSNLQDTSGGNNSTPAAIANGIAKAWVNFNGTGTVAIRASYNVSSITDNGVGDYTVNFTTAMPDTNYASFNFATFSGAVPTDGAFVLLPKTYSTTSLQVVSGRGVGAASDPAFAGVGIFR